MIGRLLLQLIIFILCLTRASSAAPSLAQPGCNDACGSVSIPYPFGVGKDCYLNEWFSINCKHSTPFFTHPNLNGSQVSSISLEGQTVVVQIATVDFCKLPESQHTQVLDRVDLEGNPFLFSKKGDAVSVSGCGSVSLLSRQDKILAGCSTICDNNGSCTGINCCRTTPPSPLNFYHLKTTLDQNHRRQEWPNCTIAALGNYIFNSTSWAESQLIWMSEESASGYNCNYNASTEWSKQIVSIYKCLYGPYEEGNP